MSDYDHKAIEKKWREKWEKGGLYKTSDESSLPKCYVLDMFPYPSGEGLHVGHPKGYIATDVYSRYKRMQGFNVLHPMGWDAFGLPAENYALKTKTHPSASVEKNIVRFKEQLSILGFDYDWSREINTSDPKFYKWTQWIFLKLFEKGLAEEVYEPINWCPKDMTGLANEDVEDGKCERCGTPVEKKLLRQWKLRITTYADRLLEGLEGLDWPKSIKESQKNWIGRSEGVNFKCRVKDLGFEVSMYNSVPQTYHAETFTVIAPEHPLVEKLVKGTPQEKEVMAFVERIKQKKLQEGFDFDKDLEGISTGRFIESFADTGRDLPIWVASYVVADYGTGIVNASAHDVRDFAFAKKYGIPLNPVMFPADKQKAEEVRAWKYAYVKDSEAILETPAQFKGRKWGEVRKDVIDHIVKAGFAERAVNYKLRDWVFSRQRYWGEPIPIIHCQICGAVAVPEKDLPVLLPDVAHYEPTGTGESPLANISDWVNTVCPKCSGAGKRETNTMPQWAGSSWYYLRYEDPHNENALVDKSKEKYWSPVDFYVGGAEHATRHLIYARFWHKFLFDIGVVNYPEPFKKLQHVGLIGGSDGRKMSKRYGNVVNPDEMVELYGADTFRLYEMFMGPFDQAIPWSTEGMMGPRRFVERLWRLREKISDENTYSNVKLEGLIEETIKKVGEDIENFKFNTAIAALMIVLNEFEKEKIVKKEDYKKILTILAPFAPHISEELWIFVGEKDSVHVSRWPVFDEQKMKTTDVVMAVQVNGKVRATFDAARGMSDGELKNTAQGLTEIKKWTEGKVIKKVIIVRDRLVSFVVE